MHLEHNRSVTHELLNWNLKWGFFPCIFLCVFIWCVKFSGVLLDFHAFKASLLNEHWVLELEFLLGFVTSGDSGTFLYVCVFGA